MMNSVSKDLRNHANGYSVLVMHLLGDFPSPFLIGYAIETFSLSVGIIFIFSWMIFNCIFWFLAWKSSKKMKDYGIELE